MDSVKKNKHSRRKKSLSENSKIEAKVKKYKEKKEILINEGHDIIYQLTREVRNKTLSEKLIFRGEPCVFKNSKPCMPMLFRSKGDEVPKLKIQDCARKVEIFIHETRKLGRVFLPTESNIWVLFIKSRMSGINSIFVDFTKNFLVSLFFACKSNDNEDGYIYYSQIEKFEGIDIMDGKNSDSHFDTMFSFKKDESIGKYLKVSSNLSNISFAQDSFLVTWREFIPNKSNFYVVRIPKKNKEKILLALYNVFNIDFSSIFPGFEGFRQAHLENRSYFNNEILYRIFEAILADKTIANSEKSNEEQYEWIDESIVLSNFTDEIKSFLFELWRSLESIKSKVAENNQEEIFYECVNICNIFRNTKKNSQNIEDSDFIGKSLCDFIEEVWERKGFFYWFAYFYFLYAFDSLGHFYLRHMYCLKRFQEEMFLLYGKGSLNLKNEINIYLDEVLYGMYYKKNWNECYILLSLMSLYKLVEPKNLEESRSLLLRSQSICKKTGSENYPLNEKITKILEDYNNSIKVSNNK